MLSSLSADGYATFEDGTREGPIDTVIYCTGKFGLSACQQHGVCRLDAASHGKGRACLHLAMPYGTSGDIPPNALCPPCYPSD